MSEITVARRYAQTLLEEAERTGLLERVDADVATLRDTLDGSRQLQLFFQSPVVSREKKRAVVQALFEARVAPVTLHFLELLVEKRREPLLPAILEAYRTLRDARQGVVEAQARLALPPGAEEQKALQAALERMTGRRVRLRLEQDPALIGGVVIRLGDTVYDGSVRHQLERLRTRLERGSFLNN
ncbi:MAG: ATP synthase subunit delta [Rhodothermaceae bacterium]|nr:MAG: ATP synthase subunit delta [Rhodothermaceae bacterium]